VTVLDADGQVVKAGQIGTTRAELEQYFGKIPKPAAVAVEATFNG